MPKKDLDFDLGKIESLAAQGLTIKQIADCLDMSRSTLYKYKKEDADIADAVKRGRSKGIATVTNALFQSAKGGNVTAQIFYLKNRQPDKWKDRRDHTHAGDEDKPVVTKIVREVVNVDKGDGDTED